MTTMTFVKDVNLVPDTLAFHPTKILPILKVFLPTAKEKDSAEIITNWRDFLVRSNLHSRKLHLSTIGEPSGHDSTFTYPWTSFALKYKAKEKGSKNDTVVAKAIALDYTLTGERAVLDVDEFIQWTDYLLTLAKGNPVNYTHLTPSHWLFATPSLVVFKKITEQPFFLPFEICDIAVLNKILKAIKAKKNQKNLLFLDSTEGENGFLASSDAARFQYFFKPKTEHSLIQKILAYRYETLPLEKTTIEKIAEGVNKYNYYFLGFKMYGQEAVIDFTHLQRITLQLNIPVSATVFVKKEFCLITHEDVEILITHTYLYA
jgi:hypothetical protein